MGRLNDLPYYRDLGHGCYSKHHRGKRDVVYHDDVTGCSRRRESRILTGIAFIMLLFLLFILFMFN